jgi:hypothetical protein
VVDALANSACRSKRRPLVTKNTGMNTPNPATSSFSETEGCTCSRAQQRELEDGAAAPRDLVRVPRRGRAVCYAAM